MVHVSGAAQPPHPAAQSLSVLVHKYKTAAETEQIR